MHGVDKTGGAGSAPWSNAASQAHQPCLEVRAFADALPVMTFVTDEGGHNLYSNKRCQSFTGRTADDLLGDGWHEVLVLEHRTAVLQTWRRAVAAGASFSFEACFISARGAEHWFLCQATPVPRDGKINAWVCVCSAMGEQGQSGMRVLGAANAMPDDRLVLCVEDLQSCGAHAASDSSTTQPPVELATIYNTVPIGLAFMDLDLRHVRINAALAELNGAPVHAHIGRTVRDMLPALADKLEPIYRSVIKTGEPVRGVEITGETPASAGQQRHWNVSYEPVRDNAGAMLGISAVVFDITKQVETRQQAEEATDRMAASERRLRDVLNGMSDAFVLLDHDFRVVDINPAALAHEARPASEIVGRTHWEAWPGSEVSEQASLYRRCMAERLPGSCTVRYEWPSGRSGVFEVHCYPVPDGVAIFYRDISERLRVDARIREGEARMRTLLDALPVGVVMAEAPSGRLLFGNGSVERVFRHPMIYSNEVDEYRAWEAYHADGQRVEADEYPLARTLATGEAAELEVHYACGDSVRRWIRISSAPVHDDTGRMTDAVVVCEDVDERREAAERERLLAREVDHRAKNMLAIVQSVVQLTRANDADALRQSVQGRIQSMARAHSLLAASRWEGADLKEVVAQELAPYLAKLPHSVRGTGPALLLRPAAAQSLAMVLHELATNAAKYGALSTPNGKLEVVWGMDALQSAPHLEIRWRESGGPPVAAPTRRGFGSGLIKASVERQLKGSVEFDWRGEGLACRIVIPTAQLMVRPRSMLPSSASFGQERLSGTPITGLRVLVVEDEPLIAMQLEAVLSNAGCEVVGPASSAEAARESLMSKLPDVAILDVNLGADRHDHGLADLLAANGIPFLFCTGYAGATGLPQHFGDAVVLAKPVGPDELLAAVGKLVSGRSN